MQAVDILKKLVSVDTTNPPGNEAELAAWIDETLKPLGFLTEQPECGKNRKSIIARLPMGEGPKLVFNGHLDVVPAGKGWTTPPFEPVIRDGKLYGRGSADMKGGVAAMMEAGIRIARNTQGLCGELCLNFVADEEIINLGTLSCKHGWEDGDYVVIGEPTNLQIAVAHKGTARFEITVEGRSCHSGMPWNGVNAVGKALKAVRAIEDMDRALETISHPLLGRPSISVTMINGGEKDNIIPGTCRIAVDYRMIPGDTGDLAEERIREYLEKIKSSDDQFEYSLRRYINLEPGEIAMDHPFVKTAKAVFEKTAGEKTRVRDFPATCEQVLFTREGIPAIVIGPGSIEQAHIVDEFVELRQVEQAAKYYEMLARHVLRKDSGQNG